MSDQLALISDDQPTSLLQAIVRLAKDPSIDVTRLEAFMGMQERLEGRQAEVAFNQALARLSSKIPPVEKNGKVDLGQGKGSYPFAKWEDIDKVIRPLMTEEGFSLSFDSQPRQADGGGLVVTGTLLHRDGHTRSASMPLALDTGPGRNNLQAMGSTLSYGKRYCAEMLLNIVRKGDDDDGTKGGAEPITEEQVKLLDGLLRETKWGLDNFLQLMGVESLPAIQKSQFVTAENLLIAKKQQMAKAKPNA